LDAFRTDAEIAFCRKVREYFVRECGSIRSGIRPSAARIWRDLLAFPGPEGPPGGMPCTQLSQVVMVVDEASCRDPRLGLDLLRRASPGARPGPREEKLLRLAGTAGAAAHVYEAGSRAARDLGFFSSSLMGFRDVQERLAGLVAGAELLRLGLIRACHIVGRGDPERTEAEIEALLERGRSLSREARSLALELLGEDWTREHLPQDGPPPADERTQR
jgi:hypothetical protein